jgi:hypothetical protein
MSLSEDLTALAEAQAALVRSLTAAAPAPDGFDPQLISLSARALVKKRVRTVARVWPQLVAALGDHYEERFQQYALKHPLPRHGGPLADGRFFARHLQQSKELPDAGRWEAFAIDLHHVMRSDGLHPRRGFSCSAAMFPQLRLLALAVKLPWLGSRILTLPYGRAKATQPTL